jgi:hypothetical protein
MAGKTALSATIPQKPQAAFCGISASIACANQTAFSGLVLSCLLTANSG